MWRIVELIGKDTESMALLAKFIVKKQDKSLHGTAAFLAKQYPEIQDYLIPKLWKKIGKISVTPLKP